MQIYLKSSGKSTTATVELPAQVSHAQLVKSGAERNCSIVVEKSSVGNVQGIITTSCSTGTVGESRSSVAGDMSKNIDKPASAFPAIQNILLMANRHEVAITSHKESRLRTILRSTDFRAEGHQGTSDICVDAAPVDAQLLDTTSNANVKEPKQSLAADHQHKVIPDSTSTDDDLTGCVQQLDGCKCVICKALYHCLL